MQIQTWPERKTYGREVVHIPAESGTFWKVQLYTYQQKDGYLWKGK